MNEALNGMDSNMLNELIEASPKESSDQDIDTDANDISKLLDSTGHLPFNNDSNNNDIAQPVKCKMVCVLRLYIMPYSACLLRC